MLRPPRIAACLVCALILSACGGSNSAPSRPAGHRTATAARHKPATATQPVTLTYHPLYNLPAPVQDPASAPLPGNGFALLGGLTPADTSSDAVIVGGLRAASERASLPNAQHDAQAAFLGGRVYVFGGGQFSEYDHILAFDPASSAVTTVGTLPAAASDAAVAGDGSRAYVVGGFDGTNWLSTVLAYTAGQPIRVLAHLPVGLRYAAAAVLGGNLLVAGGSTPTGISNAVYRIDTTTGAVTTLAHLAAGVTHAAAGVIGDTMYLAGGRGELVTDRTADLWAIDPATGTIRPAGRLPEPISDEAVISMGGRLIVAGGATAAGTGAAVGELVPSGG